METSEKVPILAWIEREEGTTIPPSQSPHACLSFAAWAKGCLQSEGVKTKFSLPYCSVLAHDACWPPPDHTGLKSAQNEYNMIKHSSGEGKKYPEIKKKCRLQRRFFKNFSTKILDLNWSLC